MLTRALVRRFGACTTLACAGAPAKAPDAKKAPAGEIERFMPLADETVVLVRNVLGGQRRARRTRPPRKAASPRARRARRGGPRATPHGERERASAHFGRLPPARTVTRRRGVARRFRQGSRHRRQSHGGGPAGRFSGCLETVGRARVARGEEAHEDALLPRRRDHGARDRRRSCRPVRARAHRAEELRQGVLLENPP